MIQSEYGWTDDQVLDLTIDRIAQCVRHITERRRREFFRNAKLYEAGVRNLAMFSAQSEQASRLAADITLVPDDRAETQTTPASQKIILPPGVDLSDVAKEDPRDEKPMIGRHLELTPDELPDDTERKVETVADNSAGSFERLMGTLPNMTQNG